VFSLKKILINSCKKKYKYLTLILVFLLTIPFRFSHGEDKSKESVLKQNADLPTYITADSLSLDSVGKHFIYKGNVKVTQGDFILTCKRLEGDYSENNEIRQLDAFEDVVIIKGDGMQTNSNKAVYFAKEQEAVLTENPSVKQGESLLIADKIRVYLDTEKTLAEGKVQMKVIKASPVVAKDTIVNPMPSHTSHLNLY
jgi:lipopolysaccharide transport protein LptA